MQSIIRPSLGHLCCTGRKQGAVSATTDTSHRRLATHRSWDERCKDTLVSGKPVLAKKSLTDDRSDPEPQDDGPQGDGPQDEEKTPKTEPEDAPSPDSPPEDVKKHWICCKCEHENNPDMGGDPPRCGNCPHEKCEDDCKMME